MFDWLREHRRRRILEQPFPSTWSTYIKRHVACVSLLDEDEAARLRDLVQVFVAEKRWEGAGGLEMDDEVRATVAAQACLLILNLEHDLYRRVGSIVVYPSSVVIPAPQRSFFDTQPQLAGASMPALGQAIAHGPVILAWDAVKRGGENPWDGSNVVYHEFAHKLDMLDGGADGVPPLASRSDYEQWVRVFSEEYESLQRSVENGKRGFLDTYALTNGAEFFAVATEAFFERSREMKRSHGELYRVLAHFFRQDPAARLE